jgi:hypothetical protein
MDAGVNKEGENAERDGGEDCGSALGCGARVKSIRTGLHDLQFDRLWIGSRRHIFLAR